MQEGKAFVDDTDKDTMRAEREERKDSKYRDTRELGGGWNIGRTGSNRLKRALRLSDFEARAMRVREWFILWFWAWREVERHEAGAETRIL